MELYLSEQSDEILVAEVDEQWEALRLKEVCSMLGVARRN